jgi:hypothetical protein
LYREAPSGRGKAPGSHGGKGESGGAAALGREEVAKAAGMDDRELRRWQPLAKATADEVEAAIERAKKVGQGVSPTTAMRAMPAV